MTTAMITANDFQDALIANGFTCHMREDQNLFFLARKDGQLDDLRIRTDLSVLQDHPDKMSVGTMIGNVGTSSDLTMSDVFNADDPADLLNERIKGNCERISKFLFEQLKIEKI